MFLVESNEHVCVAELHGDGRYWQVGRVVQVQANRR